MVGAPGSPMPASPASPQPPRPLSAMMRGAPRSASRMSVSSRTAGSRASDEDARTSVKVAVRVRPPLQATDPGYELIPQRFQKKMVHVTSPTSIAVDSPQGRKIFVFDRVFGEDIDQDGIWDYLDESVGAFVQGYNVSLLAYGQSGAGKSYTMGTSGPEAQADPKTTGVIPRAAAALFEKLSGGTSNRGSGIKAPIRYSMPLQKQSSAQKSWTLKVTYVEIYNEQLRDLLVPSGDERSPITIREDTKGRILLTGLRQVDVNSVEDLMAALDLGSSIRQTNATDMNASSSRSHAVFSLNLIQRKPKVAGGASPDAKRMSMPLEAAQGPDAHIVVDSKMHFVDLAGSERLKNTHASGERAKEGISINAGLASLGKVISQLSSRNAGSHVSYRDSKLTRLLQDSLGGNAITYMIACVNPAEFHLSETLNTIQYAQRARAIQSKPRIQQVSDESDMKALVERLRAEIAFLREQVKNNTERDSNERTVGVKGEKLSRAERSNEKEIELQNQLLDLQENYTALSNRHARVISEITRASDTEDAPASTEYADTAVERLKRSNSFAEAVETVVLEYEKTIQSLEGSLSSTRSSLAQSESTLLEKESKLAYVETVNQQLQTRLQKMMDRESSTETYLHDLESKLDGHSSGEEKSASIIAELKKEIARIRENEVGAEDYISTLEERLAESEQDMELMQREIDRLEHVIDRQRSLGKLDNLLGELDAIKDKKTNGDTEHVANGTDSPNGASISRTPSVKSTRFADEVEVVGSSGAADKPSTKNQPDGGDYPPQSPAQSQFVADKLESVQQELFDLRVEHESTLNEYDQMSANYESALRDLAAMQDQLDEARHANANKGGAGGVSQSSSPPKSPVSPPTSFLADARVSDLREEEGQLSSSRSLSSELSLAGDSPSSSDITESQIQELQAAREASREKEAALEQELRLIKKEKENALRLQEEEQERLHLQLRLSLDQLAVYKNKERDERANGGGQVLLRRKSSQSLAVLDRAQRAFTNLKRIAHEHLEGQPDVLENFELNLEGALRELQTRSERIQELENETNQVRREMEAKMSLIAGLTRERASVSTSPMDISVVAVMERRIEESESELKELRSELKQRESELCSAKKALDSASGDAQSEAITLLEELTQERALNATQAKKIAELEFEVEEIQNSQVMAFASLRESRDNLERTLETLESELKNERSLRQAAEGERSGHEDRVHSLQEIIAENRATIEKHLARVSELESTRVETQRQIDSGLAMSSLSDEEIRKQQELAIALEKTIAENRAVIEEQQTKFTTLEASYKEAMAELEALRETKAPTNNQEEAVSSMRDELEESRNSITGHLASLAKLQASCSNANETIQKLEKDKASVALEATRHAESAQELESEVEAGRKAIEEHRAAMEELQSLLAKTQKEVETLRVKEERHAKLVEEVEEQLTFTFDEKEEITKKLLAATAEYERVQQERDLLLAESESKTVQSQKVIDSLNEEITSLKASLEQVSGELASLGGTHRSNSTSSNKPALRNSNSAVSLPSPPPAIPLPPLPASAPNPRDSANAGSPVPMSRRPSKDYVVAHMEDQEARIKTLEKQLQAEKALTATLEEALTDCEKTMKRLTSDRDSFQAKASQVQQELDRTKNENQNSRYSMQAVEEERMARQRAEQARAQLEERMQALSKKNKRSFACF